MKNKTILVTGSAGFIGFHTSKKLLESGVNVVGVDNLNDYYDISLKEARNKQLFFGSGYTFRNVDITDYSALEDIIQTYKIDKICHLAAQAGVRYSLINPFIYEKVNIKGFLNILEVARKNEIQDVIYASSSSVYGNSPMPEYGFSEKQEVNDQVSFYGVTKRSNELMAATYHSLYGLHMTGLRFFTAYGPWGRPDMAYYSFVKAINDGETIQVFNNGKMKRDFTYIDDVVAGIITALDKAYPLEIFNLGNSQTVLLSEFVQIIEKELGKQATIDYQPLQPGDVLETYADISHARNRLLFHPKTTIESGIHEFVAWYKEYTNK